jgi:thiol-disulfide isomerase/thioredoxin
MPLSASKPEAKPAGKGRRRWRSWLVELALVLVVLTAAHFWNVRHAVSGSAPALAGLGIDGRPLSLASFQGKPVLVHFWATWCGVCRAQEPTIANLAKELPMITVASTSGTPEDVSRALQERGLSMPVLNDPEGQLAAKWGVNAYPTTFIVGADGRVRFVEVGYTSSLGLRARLWWAGL